MSSLSKRNRLSACSHSSNHSGTLESKAGRESASIAASISQPMARNSRRCNIIGSRLVGTVGDPDQLSSPVLFIKVVVGLDAVAKIHRFARIESPGRFKDDILFAVVGTFIMSIQAQLIN